MRWYNVDPRHKGIGYVSPAQRHDGRSYEILAGRHTLYLRAKQRHPARWSGNTRDWSQVGSVTLNPKLEAIVNMACRAPDTQQQAA